MTEGPVLTPAHFPGYMGELARRGFGGAAIRLIMEWGGTQRKIPKDPTKGKVWLQLISLDALKVLSELAPGELYDIPSKAWLRGDSLKAQIQRTDAPTREVAESLGCTERHVRVVRSMGRSEPVSKPANPSLFD